MRVTRRYRFAASHRLHSAAFTEERKSRTVRQVQQSLWAWPRLRAGRDGRRSDRSRVRPGGALPTLDRLVSEQVLQDFDHRYLNADLGEFQALVPTSENIIRVIEDRLTRPAGPMRFPANGRVWRESGCARPNETFSN